MKQIEQYFKQETLNEILPKLKKYEVQAKTYIQEIIEYEQQKFTEDELIAKENEWLLAKNQTKKQIRDFEQTMYQRLANTRKQIKMNETKIKTTIVKSYKLINDIGELFHDKIIYSITLPADANGNKISFEMPINQFLKNAVDISYTNGISLKNTDTLLNKLLKSRSKLIQTFDWQQEKNDFYNLTNYNNFLKELNIAAQGKSPIPFVNEGTKLESFFHWVNQGFANKASKHLGSDEFNSMVQALKAARDLGHNSNPYWSGGDVNNKQIKGANADVVDTKSLKQQLLRFVTMTNLLDLNKLSHQLEEARTAIDEAGIEIVTKAVNGLAHAFLHHWQFSQHDLKAMGLRLSDLC